MKNQILVSLFASGSGSNVANIIQYFKGDARIKINHVFCNKADAYVLTRAKNADIATTIFSRTEFYQSEMVLEKLKLLHTDFVVLAGFMWLTPAYLVDYFPNKILNIHPALLPKYGGKGMYGNFVHQAVVANQESESGITIHFVNEHYDEGKIVMQAKTKILATDTAEDVAQKVHQLEYQYYPSTIEKTVLAIF